MKEYNKMRKKIASGINPEAIIIEEIRSNYFKGFWNLLATSSQLTTFQKFVI